MARLIMCVAIMLVLLGESTALKLCCTQYQENPVPVKMLKFYKIQRITDNCNLPAVIFKTVKNKLLCANPESKWVQKAMESVPEKM